MACECDWPRTCGGSGILKCHTCGGDFCICWCGGEEECWGCADCENDEPGYDEDEDDAARAEGPQTAPGETGE
jgi:hypothetical protein